MGNGRRAAGAATTLDVLPATNDTIQRSLLLLCCCCCCLSLKVTKSPDPISARPPDRASKLRRGVTSKHRVRSVSETTPSSLLHRLRLAILTPAPWAVCARPFPELILNLSAASSFLFFPPQGFEVCCNYRVCLHLLARPVRPCQRLRCVGGKLYVCDVFIYLFISSSPQTPASLLTPECGL